jgi:AraC-like DNA-binding protein
MQDRLIAVLQYFELTAHVFQAGPLPQDAHYRRDAGLGYLHILRSGAIEISSPNHDQIVIDEPALVMYLAPTTHSVHPLTQETEMVCASFELGSGAINPLAHALPHMEWFKLAECPQMRAVLEVLIAEAAQQHCGRQAVLDRLMEVVLVQSLRVLMDQQRVEIGLLAGLADQRLCPALIAMHDNPAHPWTLEEMAALAGMSRARFARHFRDILGTTPGAHLNHWRLMAAQSLLVKGRDLDFVASAVGYQSASALSRVFKEKVGESPGRWARSRR